MIDTDNNKEVEGQIKVIDTEGMLGKTLAFSSKLQELSESMCKDFEPRIPDNCYSFCKHATFWIDGQGERTCPFAPCPCASNYSPVLKGIYCSINQVANNKPASSSAT